MNSIQIVKESGGEDTKSVTRIAREILCTVKRFLGESRRKQHEK